MNSQESVSIEKENKVQNELQIQKTLKQARDSFQTQDVTAMDVLKCEYIDKNTVLYDNKEYNISRRLIKYIVCKEKIYVCQIYPKMIFKNIKTALLVKLLWL